MAELYWDTIQAQLGGKVLLDNLSLRLGAGELVALLGANGAGKTSLLKTALNLVPLEKGSVHLNGSLITDLSPRDRAREVSYLPQTRPLAWPLLVRDVVALGRFAYGGATGQETPETTQIVAHAMAECEIEHLARRPADQLSGGELARVHCARVFAGQTPLLLADEPVSALDPHHQLQIMGLLRNYANRGGGALVVMHDVTLAATFANRLVWLKAGRIAADGPPRETLTAARMADVFGVGAQISWNGPTPQIQLHPLPRE